MTDGFTFKEIAGISSFISARPIFALNKNLLAVDATIQVKDDEKKRQMSTIAICDDKLNFTVNSPPIQLSSSLQISSSSPSGLFYIYFLFPNT